MMVYKLCQSIGWLFLWDVAVFGQSLVFPQFVDGGGVRTEVVLTNPGEESDSGMIVFRNPLGGALGVVIGGSVQTSIEYELAPGGVFQVRTDGTGELVSGYALAVPEKASSRITGTITYNLNPFEVSVGNSVPSREYHVFAERTVESRSGVAIVNPGSSSIDLTVLLFDMQGDTVASEQMTLEAGRQVARFVDEIFDNVGVGFIGSVHALADGEFSFLGLRQRESGSLSVLSGAPVALARATVVGSQGGDVVSEDGVLKLSFPPGALEREFRVAVVREEVRPPGIFSGEFLGATYKLSPSSVSFSSPAVATLEYSDLGIEQGQGVFVVHWEEDGSFAEVVEVVNDLTQKSLVFELDHFSYLGLIRDDTAGWSVFRYRWTNPVIRWYLDEGSLGNADPFFGSWLSVDRISEALNQWSGQNADGLFQPFRFEQTEVREIAELVFEEAGSISELEGSLCGLGVPYFRRGLAGVTCVDNPFVFLGGDLGADSSVVIKIASDALDSSTKGLHVILHEIGHALGIAHAWSGNETPVMTSRLGVYPTVLHPWDLEAVFSKYGGSVSPITRPSAAACGDCVVVSSGDYEFSGDFDLEVSTEVWLEQETGIYTYFYRPATSSVGFDRVNLSVGGEWDVEDRNLPGSMLTFGFLGGNGAGVGVFEDGAEVTDLHLAETVWIQSRFGPGVFAAVGMAHVESGASLSANGQLLAPKR